MSAEREPSDREHGRAEGDPSARKHGRAVRAFFAWALPEEAKAALGSLARALRARPDGDAVRWVRSESYHVTLCFLGNVPTALVPALVEAVHEQLREAKPFELALGAVHAFPSTRQPRVVVVSLAPEAPLAALAERIRAGVVAVGLPVEKRRFRAHLTLGRLRSRRLPALDDAELGLPALSVGEVVLLQSELGRDGSRYTPLARLPLPSTAAPAVSLPLPTSFQ